MAEFIKFSGLYIHDKYHDHFQICVLVKEISAMDEQQLSIIIKTLNHIEVHGKENMDRLLGCILALERMLQKMGENHERDSEGNA